MSQSGYFSMLLCCLFGSGIVSDNVNAGRSKTDSARQRLTTRDTLEREREREGLGR